MRRIRIVAAIAAGILVTALLPAAPAFADTTGVITLQLTTPSGSILRLAGVELYINGDAIENLATTDSEGKAVLGSFPSGISLGVMANLPEGSKYLGPQMRGIPTNPGSAPVTVKLAIPVGASISGTVKNSYGSRVSGAEVHLLTTSGALLATAVTSATGSYKFAALPTGKYRVQFNARGTSAWLNPAAVKYGWRYWYGSSSWAGADSISVHQQTSSSSASVKTGVSGAVSASKSIIGSVRNAPSGSTVTVEGSDLPNRFRWVLTPSADPQKFTVRLGKGYYRIGITGYDGTTIFWWTGNSTLASSDHAQAKRYYFSGSSTVSITVQLPAP